MSSDEKTRAPELAALDVLLGEWVVQLEMPDIPPGHLVVEWTLDGAYLVQRTDVEQSAFPSSLAVIAPNPDTGGYTQHYFDSRGVVRIYEMNLEDEVWTLVRNTPDFSPLDFAQRFSGRISADGRTIEATWERSDDGGQTWELDFPLTYTRRRLSARRPPRRVETCDPAP